MLLVLSLGCAGVAATSVGPVTAHAASSEKGSAVGRGARRVGHAVAEGARKGGHAVAEGARKGGHAVAEGARGVGRWVSGPFRSKPGPKHDSSAHSTPSGHAGHATTSHDSTTHERHR
jgi:hypothetical protein